MISAPHPWRWLCGGAICALSITLGVDRWFMVLRAPVSVASDPAPVPPPLLPATWSLDRPPARTEISARIASWLALDPAVSPYAERALGLRALLVVADAGQLAALADRLARRGGEDDARWFATVFARWIELDAASATRWTSTLGAGNRLPVEAWAKARETAALSWARATFDPAYSWALGEPDADQPDGVAARLLGWLAETDPARALALAEARGPEAAAATLKPIFDTWAKRDPAAALNALGARLLAARVEFEDLHDALKNWLHLSPDAALGWMRAQSRIGTGQQELLALRLGSLKDRLASAEAIARSTDPVLKHRLLREMFSGGWYGDREEAAAVLDRLDDPDLRARLIHEISQSVSVQAPQESLPFVLRLPPGGERDQRIIDVTSAWARRDPLAALEWLKTRDEASVAYAVQAATLGSIAQDEPQTALATWGSLPAGSVRDQAVAEIAQGWAHHDPAQAAAWLAAQGATQASPPVNDYDVVQPILEKWVAGDAAAARAWAEVQLGASGNQTPLRVWAQETSRSQTPAAAAEAIGQIADARLRAELLGNHGREWLKRDVTAARVWLEKQAYVPPATVLNWIEEARVEAASR